MSANDAESDVIILGAGISGLSAAHFLTLQGRSVRIIDSYEQAGGNHLSRQVGPYTFDIGAIFFWSDNPQFEMFAGLIETCLPIHMSIQKLAPGGMFCSYPYDLSRELFAQRFTELLAVGSSLISSRISSQTPESAADFAIKRIGERLYESSGLRNYLDRFYGIPGESVSVSFARRRMMWIHEASSIPHLVKRLGNRIWRTARRRPSTELQCYARPWEGFTAYYGVIETRLREAGVKFELGLTVDELRRVEDQHRVSTGRGVFLAKRLISTIPITSTAALCGLSTPNLQSLTLTTLFCSSPGEPQFEGTVLYNFHPDGRWKRLTLHSKYYGKANGRHFFAVECTHLSTDLTPAILFDDFATHASRYKLFSDAVSLEDSLTVEKAYPIYSHGFEQILTSAVQTLSALGIESLGRQGNFDYIPSSTLAIELAREAMG